MRLLERWFLRPASLKLDLKCSHSDLLFHSADLSSHLRMILEGSRRKVGGLRSMSTDSSLSLRHKLRSSPSFSFVPLPRLFASLLRTCRSSLRVKVGPSSNQDGSAVGLQRVVGRESCQPRSCATPATSSLSLPDGSVPDSRNSLLSVLRAP